MADDVVDYYGGTSDSDSERDKVPSIFLGKAYSSIKQPLTAHDPIHPQVSSRPHDRHSPSGSLLYGSIPGMGPTPEDLFFTGLGRWSSVPPVK
jgi:hypothetical protein